MSPPVILVVKRADVPRATASPGRAAETGKPVAVMVAAE